MVRITQQQEKTKVTRLQQWVNTKGTYNIAVGCLRKKTVISRDLLFTTGYDKTAVGITGGLQNTAIGNTKGNHNTAVGFILDILNTAVGITVSDFLNNWNM